MKPTRAKMVAGVLLVFLAGAILGGLGTRIHMEHRIRGLVREGPPARMVPRFIGRLIHELDLPPDRRAEVEAVARELQKELIALRGKYRPELDAILNEHLDRIRERLTPEERERMDDFRERHWKERARRDRHRRENGADGRLRDRDRRLLESLEATPEQEQAVRPVLEEFFRERRALAKRMRFAEGGEASAIRREMDELRERAETRLAAVLTPKQMERVRETRGLRREEKAGAPGETTP